MFSDGSAKATAEEACDCDWELLCADGEVAPAEDMTQRLSTLEKQVAETSQQQNQELKQVHAKLDKAIACLDALNVVNVNNNASSTTTGQACGLTASVRKPDPAIPNASSYDVVDHYDISLAQTNSGSNNNKFYHLQVLRRADDTYLFWTHWGRDGQVGQFAIRPAASKADAVAQFEKKFHDKTKNDFSALDRFVHIPGKYHVVRTTGFASTNTPNDDLAEPGHVNVDEAKTAETTATDTAATAKEDPLNMEKLLNDLNCKEPQQTFETVRRLRRLLSQPVEDSVYPSQPVKAVLEELVTEEVVALLAHHLFNGFEGLKFEAAWALTNIAAGPTKYTRMVVNSSKDKDIIHYLRDLTQDGTPDMQEQALWCLGNIAGESSSLRDRVTDSGVLPSALTLLDTYFADETHVSFVRTAAWVICNLCRGKKPRPDIEVFQALPILVRVMQQAKDVAVVSDACWAVSYLCDGPNDRIQMVMDANTLPAAIECSKSTHKSICTPALRILGNFVTGTALQTRAAVDAGVLDVFKGFLYHESTKLRKDAAWSISNICADVNCYVDEVISSGVVPVLVEMADSAEGKLRREVAWALSNLLELCKPAHYTYLVNTSKVQLCLLNMLKEGIEDVVSTHIVTVLDGLATKSTMF